MSKEWLVESTRIRACKSPLGGPRCEALDCRWGVGLLVRIEFVEPKRESATIKLCGNVDCFDSKCYSDLLAKHGVRDNQELVIRTYKNDNGETRQTTQVRNHF